MTEFTIIGVDISTYHVHYACITEFGFSWKEKVELGTDKDTVLTRIRRVEVPNLLAFFHDDKQDPTPILVIEEAMGHPKTTAVLQAVVGAVTVLTPDEVLVSWMSVTEWRGALGCKNNKPAGHEAIKKIMADWPGEPHILADTNNDVSDWDEHELDALGVALGFATKYGMLGGKSG